MQPNTDTSNTSPTFPSLESAQPKINSPEFQQGYRDGYVRESQQTQHPDYLIGYLYGSKDRVLYRDC